MAHAVCACHETGCDGLSRRDQAPTIEGLEHQAAQQPLGRHRAAALLLLDRLEQDVHLAQHPVQYVAHRHQRMPCGHLVRRLAPGRYTSMESCNARQAALSLQGHARQHLGIDDMLGPAPGQHGGGVLGATHLGFAR